MDTLLEWKIVVGRRRFTGGHRTVGREEEDRNNHGRTSDGLHVKQKLEDMAEDGCIWRLGLDGRLLAI